MARTRSFLLLFLALPLAGCLSGQRKQLATCEVNATHQFPQGATPGEPLKSIQGCMTKAGYTFIGWDDGVVCDIGAVVRGKPSITGGDALCFQPSNWLALKYYRLIEVPAKSQAAGAN